MGTNPMLFKEVFKVQYEVFKILVKWLKSDLGTEKYRDTPFSTGDTTAGEAQWIRKQRLHVESCTCLVRVH